MPLPSEIPVRYNEDDAGYVTMRPVVKQVFRLEELVDMVVSVVGKDPSRVQQIFRTGTVLYHGYHYWWDSLDAGLPEIDSLLAHFPEDDPLRVFDASRMTTVLLESGGGTQRNMFEIEAKEASEKRLLGKTSPWQVLRSFAIASHPRYEKYSYSRHADLFRLTIPFEQGQQLLASLLAAAPNSLRHRWSVLRPPAALTFVVPR